MSAELFQNKLTVLNKNFLQFITKKLEQYPSADLSPTIKTYTKHLSDLDKLYAGPESHEKKVTNRPFKKALPPSAKLKRFPESANTEPTAVSNPVEIFKPTPKITSVPSTGFSSNPPTFSNPGLFAAAPVVKAPAVPSFGIPKASEVSSNPPLATSSSSEGNSSSISSGPEKTLQLPFSSSDFGSLRSSSTNGNTPSFPTVPKPSNSNSFTPYSTEQRLSRKRQAKSQLSYDEYLEPLETSSDKKSSTFKPPPSFDPFIFKKKDDAPTFPAAASSSLLFAKKNDPLPPTSQLISHSEDKKKDEAPACPTFPSFSLPKSVGSTSDPAEDPKPSDPTPPKFNLFGSSAVDKKETPKFNFLNKTDKNAGKNDSGISVFGSKSSDESKASEKIPTLADLFRNDVREEEPSLSLFLKKPEGEAPPFSLFSNKPTTADTASTQSKEDEEKEEPPQVEAVDQSEPDALFSAKANVHVLKDGTTAWNKLGVGYVNIKELGDKKQLLVRAATTLGTIWMNTVINNHVKSFKMSEKRIKVRFPNKVMDEKTKEESVKISTYLLTVGAPDCDKLAEYLNAATV